jgi:endonuclease III
MDNRRELYLTISGLLSQNYGYPDWRQHLPPVDELVSTILSQSTTDLNRDKGFYALKARYADWESVRDAPVDDIENTIRPAGLAKQKAPRIKNALQYVTDHVGKLSLDFLQDMDIAAAKTWLTQIDGVGPKTAAIILLFSFNRPAFPVDTHVHRVTGRLGLIDEKTSADKAHDMMESIAEPKNFYADHLNIIRHGREICKARNPLCNQCFLRDHCRYYGEIAR